MIEHNRHLPSTAARQMQVVRIAVCFVALVAAGCDAWRGTTVPGAGEGEQTTTRATSPAATPVDGVDPSARERTQESEPGQQDGISGTEELDSVVATGFPAPSSSLLLRLLGRWRDPAAARGEAIVSAIEVRVEGSATVLQVLGPLEAVAWLDPYAGMVDDGDGFVVEDLDFDGVPDLRLQTSASADGSDPYRIWLFDVEMSRFVVPEAFEQIVSPRPDPERALLHSDWRDGPLASGTDSWAWRDGVAVMVERTTTTRFDDGPTMVRLYKLDEDSGELALVEETYVPQQPADAGCPAPAGGEAVHVSTTLDFCLNHPEDFVVMTAPELNQLILKGPPHGDGPAAPRATLIIRRLGPSGDRDASSLAEEQLRASAVDPAAITRHATTINGARAEVVDGLPGAHERREAFVILDGVAWALALEPLDLQLPDARADAIRAWRAVIASLTLTPDR